MSNGERMATSEELNQAIRDSMAQKGATPKEIKAWLERIKPTADEAIRVGASMLDWAVVWPPKAREKTGLILQTAQDAAALRKAGR